MIKRRLSQADDGDAFDVLQYTRDGPSNMCLCFVLFLLPKSDETRQYISRL